MLRTMAFANCYCRVGRARPMLVPWGCGCSRMGDCVKMISWHGAHPPLPLPACRITIHACIFYQLAIHLFMYIPPYAHISRSSRGSCQIVSCRSRQHIRHWPSGCWRRSQHTLHIVSSEAWRRREPCGGRRSIVVFDRRRSRMSWTIWMRTRTRSARKPAVCGVGGSSWAIGACCAV